MRQLRKHERRKKIYYLINIIILLVPLQLETNKNQQNNHNKLSKFGNLENLNIFIK
jgi:hypothetical protein